MKKLIFFLLVVILFSAGVCCAENSYREFMIWSISKLGDDPDTLWGENPEVAYKNTFGFNGFSCKKYIKSPSHLYISCDSEKNFNGKYNVTAHFFDNQLVALEYFATDPTISETGPEFGGTDEAFLFNLWLSEKFTVQDIEETELSPFLRGEVEILNRSKINTSTYYYFGEEAKKSTRSSYKLHWIFMSGIYLDSKRPVTRGF